MPETGHFILHSAVLPQVQAGRHVLRTEQQGQPFAVEALETHVQVASPRFVMPPAQVLSTFPPANAAGNFDDRLPQIVLKRRTLPWERNAAGGAGAAAEPWLALVVVAEGEAQLSTPTAVQECRTPEPGWVDPDPTGKDTEQGLYLAVTRTVVHKLFPKREHLSLLAHVRQVDVQDTELMGADDDGWMAVVLANRLPVFDHGQGKPVRYLACLLNLEGQLGRLPTTEEESAGFRFELAQDWSHLAAVAQAGPDRAVQGGSGAAAAAARPVARAVAGGGLRGGERDGERDGPPVTPALTAAATAKVQLGAELGGQQQIQAQPYADHWRTQVAAVAQAARDPDARVAVRDAMGAGFRLPIDVLVIAEPVYRFPVLAHWSFTATQGANFETLMQGLNVGLLGGEPEPVQLPAGQTPAPLPAPDPLPPPEVVATGHIGLNHRTRRGEPTRAWYRGPLVPFPLQRDEGPPPNVPNVPAVPAHASDQLRRVVPDGREDLSYAAAFEIGRLTALSQLSVVSALQRLRQAQFGVGRRRELLDHAAPKFAPPLASSLPADMGRHVAYGALGALAAKPGRALGVSRPMADPGRELDLPDDLEALVAEGLGMDLPALLRQAKTIGVLGALTREPVPVAARAPKVDPKAAGAVLAAALDAELGTVLATAQPPKRREAERSGPHAGPHARQHGPAGAAQRAAAPLPADALDERMSAWVQGEREDEDESEADPAPTRPEEA